MANRRGDYEKHREDMAAASRKRSTAGREIGEIPPIANVRRRSKCRKSLRLFCETYNPIAFKLGWSPDHLKAIARIEESATQGALFAFAMARGSGKTAICRMAALWVVSYAIRRYAFVIGSTDKKACESMDTIRTLIRFGGTYAADFPEISHAARALGGIANRATGQTCDGVSTMIEWSNDSIMLPTVPCPANWPRSWPKRSDGMAPTSGVIVYASGLTGEGLRGSNKTLTTGEMIRPDFVLLDDPQTPESARSKSQNQTRYRLVSSDVLGMAGPEVPIAAVMPCTVIEPGDMVDEILDRSKNPLWRGERSGIFTALPTNLAAWDAYFEIYARCAQMEPPNYGESNAYYVKNQAVLDAGCEATWPDRKGVDLSAIQHAMHLYFRDRRGFMAEYMNRPEAAIVASASALNADAILTRASNLPRGIVPRECTRLTAFIDVGAHVLWWMVCAWDERFGGTILDYGSFPDQRRTYFTEADARITLGTLPELQGQPQSAAIYSGLTSVAAHALGRVYQQEGTGAEMRIERGMVDANWGPGTDLVYEFCRRSEFSAILLPSHGRFIGVTSNPMHTWTTRPGERAGWCWRMSSPSNGRGRHITFDANHWKTFAAERMRTAEGAPGCVRLYQPDDREHVMLADHFTAEYPVSATSRSSERTVDEWKDIPSRDNHWWDCFVGCCVVASVQGLLWSSAKAAGVKDPLPPSKPPKPLSELQRERARDRESREYERNEL